jgi:hypothetical protein
MSQERPRIPNAIDVDLQAKIWEHNIPAQVLPRIFFRNIWNKYVARKLDPLQLVPAANCDGLVVYGFENPHLFGGGAIHAPDFLRVILELRLGPVDRLCDFCAGTGYIGFSLFARRFCRTLCCIDVDKRSIDAVQLTATANGITDLVTTFVSDGLNDVPETEKWDLLVCNPPQLQPRVATDVDTAFTFDPDWKLHRNAYSGLKKFMKLGGHAIFLEAKYETSAKTFAPMVEAGGGKIVAEIPAKDFRGREDDRYFVVTQW